MANFTFNGTGSLPAIDLVTTGPALINLLNSVYNRAEFSSTTLELSQNNNPLNQTIFRGTGLEFAQDPITRKLVITDGTVTDIEINLGSPLPLVDISGLSQDAVALGLELSAGSEDLWSLFLSGDDTIIGDTGDDVLRGFDGTDTVTGGAGADDFAYFAGDDVLIITDFNPGEDQIGFGGLGEDFTLADLLPFVSQVGDDVEIRSGDQAVIVQDTLLANMTEADVFFFT